MVKMVNFMLRVFKPQFKKNKNKHFQKKRKGVFAVGPQEPEELAAGKPCGTNTASTKVSSVYLLWHQGPASHLKSNTVVFYLGCMLESPEGI